MTEVCVGTIAGECGSNTSPSDFGVAPIATGKFEETSPIREKCQGVFQGDRCKRCQTGAAKFEVGKSTSKSVLAVVSCVILLPTNGKFMVWGCSIGLPLYATIPFIRGS